MKTPGLQISPLLLSRGQAANVLGISLRQLDYLVAAGLLKARAIGRSRKIPYAEAVRFSRADHPTIIRRGIRSAK
jgi:excisionase family DNA binding protein